MGNDKSTLDIPQTTTPLDNRDLLRHHHHMLNHYLPGLEPTFQSVQESLIVTHIGETTVELRQDRKAKALACKANDEKGIPDLLRSNLTYRLHLGQADNYEDPQLSGRSLR